MPKKPTAAELFTFEHDGKTYRLPSSTTKFREVPGRLIRDAYMEGDEGETRLGFALLEMVDAEPGVVDALYTMPAPEMLVVIRDWLRFRPSREDATLGESSASPN